MRLTPIKLVAIILCTTCLSMPANARGFGLGGVLGLVTVPLHMLGRGVLHGVPLRHARGTPAHVLATPEPPKPPATTEAPARTEPTEPARSEARLDVPREAPPSAAQRQPPLAWPQASPSVYEDLLGYILWPQDYADRLWAHGYDDIVSTALMPAAARSDQMPAMLANGMCSKDAQALADKPIARIADTLELRTDQRATLDELRAALGQAVERGRAALCGGAGQSSGDRFKPMIDALWTMWDTTILMRTPLEKFYNSLTPDQKAKLASASPADAKAAGACAAQRSAQFPAERIRQAIGAGGKPTPEQQRALETLQQRFTELAQFLATSCPQANDRSPMLRLSAAGDRMNALMYAVLNMGPAMAAVQGGQ